MFVLQGGGQEAFLSMSIGARSSHDKPIPSGIVYAV